MMSLVTRTSVPSGSGLSTAEIESVPIYQLGLYIADTLSDATVGSPAEDKIGNYCTEVPGPRHGNIQSG